VSARRRGGGRVKVLAAVLVALAASRVAEAGAEVRLDRDFLAGVVEQLPAAPFKKDGQYHGEARAFRLVGIDPKKRQLVAACAVVGAYRPPVAAALHKAGAEVSGADPTKGGWKSFAFDVTVGLRIEPGPDGAPVFSVDVEQVKRRELEGVAGALAMVLGRYFDNLVTQVADGKVTLLSRKINTEVQKRLGAFRQYGVLRSIAYAPEGVLLTFDVTRLRLEGVIGYVHAGPQPGTVPLHRWVNPSRGDHFYTTVAGPAGQPGPAFTYEGVVAHVPAAPGPGTQTMIRWRGRREWFFTSDPRGEGLARYGYRPETAAFLLYAAPPPAGAVPFYRFLDSQSHNHFYTTNPHAEFLK
jgi:hypothetical protein